MKTVIASQIIFDSDEYAQFYDYDNEEQLKEISIIEILKVINSGKIHVEAIDNYIENNPKITLYIKHTPEKNG